MVMHPVYLHAGQDGLNMYRHISDFLNDVIKHGSLSVCGVSTKFAMHVIVMVTSLPTS